MQIISINLGSGFLPLFGSFGLLSFSFIVASKHEDTAQQLMNNSRDAVDLNSCLAFVAPSASFANFEILIGRVTRKKKCISRRKTTERSLHPIIIWGFYGSKR